MGAATGTLQSVVIDGVPYDVMSDTNISFLRSKFEKEATPTSGKPLIKMTKRNQNVESVDLACEPSELETLATKADGLAEVTLSFTLADGSVYRGTGHINFEGYESETGKVTLTLLPTSDWTPFIV